MEKTYAKYSDKAVKYSSNGAHKVAMAHRPQRTSLAVYFWTTVLVLIFIISMCVIFGG